MEQKSHTVVRYTTLDDLDKVLSIYDSARRRMRESGNPNQWIDGYPSKEVVTEDINRRSSLVIEINGEIAGVFTFFIGEDPTYNKIYGEWLNNKPYGTIHRIASAPEAKGVADICLDYCTASGYEIRIDTHEDNAPMLGWIRSRGFQYCGIIHCANGTPRLAFQLQNNNIHPKL